jgi:hypothetical protein
MFYNLTKFSLYKDYQLPYFSASVVLKNKRGEISFTGKFFKDLKDYSASLTPPESNNKHSF